MHGSAQKKEIVMHMCEFEEKKKQTPKEIKPKWKYLLTMFKSRISKYV